MQTEDGKWRVEFDEPWAREGAKPPERRARPETPATDAAAPAEAARVAAGLSAGCDHRWSASVRARPCLR